MASCDKTVKCWDLASNQSLQVAQHDGPVKTCHWIKAPNYQALMTSSWDKTLKVSMFIASKITAEVYRLLITSTFLFSFGTCGIRTLF